MATVINPNGVAEKDFNAVPLARSVIELPTEDAAQAGGAASLIWMVGSLASEMAAWGTNPLVRDRQLREFITTESVLSGAISTIVARNAALDWEVKAPKATLKRVHEMLHNANFGSGWLDFITKFSWDLYASDKGAFVEIIKASDAEDAPTVGIANLDSARCYHTGNPEYPVVYNDMKGKYHVMPWYRVWTASEMPMPHETLYGMQFCAVSRVLHAARTYRNIQTYVEEKSGGRHNRAIQLIGGVTASELKAAFALSQAENEQRGNTRYAQPVVVAALNPNTTIQHETIELSSLPDNFDALSEFQRYVAIMAMCLLTDYLELAPLPGSNLGTATQAQTMEKKSHAKGAQLFIKIVEHMLNFAGIIPRNAEFSYTVDDPEKDKLEEGFRLARAQRRQQMIANGEIDANVSRQMALDDGDIPQELFQKMIAVTDVTGETDIVEQPDDETLDDDEQGSQASKSYGRTVTKEVVRDSNGFITRIIERSI